MQEIILQTKAGKCARYLEFLVQACDKVRINSKL